MRFLIICVVYIFILFRVSVLNSINFLSWDFSVEGIRVYYTNIRSHNFMMHMKQMHIVYVTQEVNDRWYGSQTPRLCQIRISKKYAETQFLDTGEKQSAKASK